MEAFAINDNLKIVCYNQKMPRKEKLKTIKLAVSGDAGSFSEEAGLLYAEREFFKPELVYAIGMDGVLQTLDDKKVELGIFPVVNSQGGLVRQAFDAMGNHLFRVIDELWLEVQQCLMVLPGTKKEKIKTVASHSQAIIQCQRYIKREFPNVKTLEWADTAAAARDLASGKLSKDTAVLAPARSAHLYNLEILGRGIQDAHPNLTTFIVVTK